MRKPVRLLLVLPAGVALLAGLDAALLLLGLPAPVTTERLPQVHGPLLVLGFIGTLVAAERAVALRRPWAVLAPLLLGAGSLALLSPAPLPAGQGLLVAGCATSVALLTALWRRQPTPWLAVQALGGVLATGAALLWWGGTPVPATLPWLAGFVVLTVAGERVELARVGGPGVQRHSLALAAAVTCAVLATLVRPGPGHVALGAALLTLVAHLVRHDVARRTIRSTGLPRYTAGCLLAGYGWLAVAGTTWLLAGAVTSGGAYDAVVHAVFLGFTLSMVMAHAPVVLPAVLHVRLPYHAAMAVPVVLLHASLVLRVVAGDLHGHAWALTLGGALNVAAVLLFAATAVSVALRHRARRTPRPAPAVRRAPSASAPVTHRVAVEEPA